MFGVGPRSRDPSLAGVVDPERRAGVTLILPDGNVSTLQAGCPKATGYRTISVQSISVKRTSKQ